MSFTDMLTLAIVLAVLIVFALAIITLAPLEFKDGDLDDEGEWVPEYQYDHAPYDQMKDI